MAIWKKILNGYIRIYLVNYYKDIKGRRNKSVQFVRRLFYILET